MTHEHLQKTLQSLGYYQGRVDGVIGVSSTRAINNFLERWNIKEFHNWPLARRIVAAKQLACRIIGIEVGEIDGLVGPQTRYAFEVWVGKSLGDRSAEIWRNREAEDLLSELNTQSVWPLQREVEKYYGRLGQNQVMIDLPYPMKIAWDKERIITRISLHEKVADSAVRVLNRVGNEYDEESRSKAGLDLFAGSFNVRKARGGSFWSMHSWGIAIDFDSERNQLKWGRDKARLAKPDCEKFWKLWEEEGWVSLGRTKNYDFMHIQAARLL